MKKINVNLCFKEAWKGFKGWWIPLCLVSTAIMLTQVSLPKRIVYKELETLKPYKQAYEDFKSQTLNLNSISQPEKALESYQDFVIKCSEISSDKRVILAFIYLLMKLFAILGLIICILNIIMIVLAKASVEPDKKKRTVKRDLSRGIILSLSYILLAFIKMIPFIFCLLPGFYIYCKLYFTGFIITEESADPFTAMKKSWKMTEGNFWEVLIIFLVTIAVNVISIMTIIGVIPGTSYNYTLRAAAYRQLKIDY